MARRTEINPQLLTNMQARVIAECIRLRMESETPARELAARLGWSPSRITKWEQGRWLEDADDIIAAYATLGSMEPALIWRRALRGFTRDSGESPSSILDRARSYS